MPQMTSEAITYVDLITATSGSDIQRTAEAASKYLFQNFGIMLDTPVTANNAAQLVRDIITKQTENVKLRHVDKDQIINFFATLAQVVIELVKSENSQSPAMNETIGLEYIAMLSHEIVIQYKSLAETVRASDVPQNR